MPDRVLPTLTVVKIVGKSLHDESVDLTEGHLLLGVRRDGHGDQGYVGVGGLLPGLLIQVRGCEVVVREGSERIRAESAEDRRAETVPRGQGQKVKVTQWRRL